MKKLLVRSAIVVVVLLGLAVFVIGLALGSLVKKGVETVGPALTKTEMKLDGASLSLLSGSGGIKGLVVGNPEGYKTPSAIKVGSASLGVKPMSVFGDKVHVTHVRIQGPEITFEGKGLKENNLSKILENVDAVTGGSGTNQPPPEGASRKLQVDEVSVTGGKINLSATFLGGQAMTLPLPEIQMRNLGQGPEGITAAELTKRLLSEVTANTLKAVGQAAGDLGKGAVDAATDAAKRVTDGAKDPAKSLGNLLKKK